MRRAKRSVVDLSMPVKQMQSFFMDDVFLTDALWAIVEPEATAKGLTLEQFESGLDGTVLASARDALWDALSEYFDPGKSEMLRAAVASVAKEMATATASLTGTGSVESKASLATRNVDFETVAANDYNLSVSSYVEAEDTREKTDIGKVNAELKTTVARIDQLRSEIDAIVAEIEGEEGTTDGRR